ncbi:sortase domain-bontaining protein [Chloroflexota bacterium]
MKAETLPVPDDGSVTTAHNTRRKRLIIFLCLSLLGGFLIPVGIIMAASGGTELIVSKTDGLYIVHEALPLTYTVSIRNTGSQAAENVIITDVLGSDYDYISYIMGTTNTQSSPQVNTLVWSLNEDVDPGESIAFTLFARVKTNLNAPLALTNIVTASTTTSETNITNNVFTDTNLAPAFEVIYSVTPVEVNLNEQFRFQIQITNRGTTEASSVTVETQVFPTELSIINPTTTKTGATVLATGGSVSASLGTLSVGETVYVNFSATVISAPSQTTTYNNIATLRWNPQQPIQTKQSNTIAYRITGTSLPPTGGFEKEGPPTILLSLGIISGLILGISGIASLGYGIWIWGRNPTWAPWFLTSGIILTTACLAFNLLALAIGADFSSLMPRNISGTGIPGGKLVYFQEPWVPKSTPHAPETLPDYPIPTPDLETVAQAEAESPQEPDEEPVDTSPVVRIIIPALDLDTVVKYVPFQGFTWLIAGLKDEIAWMGDTSWPGLGSNTGLAGHVTLKDGSDGPFNHLFDLASGEEVILHTEENIYTYRVRDGEVVDAGDLTVTKPSEVSQLSLITCTGWDSGKREYQERLVVIADLVKVEPQRRQISSLAPH